ncbi:MAG TPA: site-2 protease family protein [Patescibacteria group bacterium]|nr:site-2 protease family protein [Patescibacteria group bacterium]
MFRKTIRLFRLFGIPVELDLSWILILVLVTWTFATGYYPENFPGLFSIGERWLIGLITALLLFASILLHEFSHSLVAIRNGLPIRRITLFMFGGVAQMDREVDDPLVELKMAAAGPLMSVILAALFYSLSLLSRSLFIVPVLMRSLANLNVAVLVFNMVPGFPLDGGRILRAAIWYRTGNLRRATRIASRIGSGFAILLMLAGLFFFISYGSFIGGLWLIFIGFFLRQAARSGYMMVAFKETLGHMRVAEVMQPDVVTVDVSSTLSSLVDDYFLRYHYSSFPVVEGRILRGIISLEDLRNTDRTIWQEVTVGEVLDPAFAAHILHPHDPAEKLLHFIMRKGYDRLPVVDDDGSVVGVVTRQDLLATIKVMTSLKE